MFKRLLIANRGEIAVRIARTAKRMGVSTVAVFAPVEAGALHAVTCDMAIALPDGGLAENYLNRNAILAAAKAAGADAIHPGYGFLSEDAAFAQAVMDAGLIWVGPPPQSIAAMGLKDAAKALMEQAGVPVVPGYSGQDQSAEALRANADVIGFPLMIKAVAGGGGKGMRVVMDVSDFDSALKSAKGEALNAFGNDAVLLEKYIEHPRHIEVQILGDGHTTVHLAERECSVQRRHQKVIEEAPAPGVDAKLRAQIGDIAVKAAEAIGYTNAGTVEFIVDGAGPLSIDKFFFMEMNTRLQVEHPVTEEILGLDLVEWQLRVAAGERLAMNQGNIAPCGHAIEMRLYCEDPANGFLPSPGPLDHLRFPKNARVDTGVQEGDVVRADFDPMIAKIIVQEMDRDMALRSARDALIATEVAGAKTNRDFLLALLDQDPVTSANASTDWLDRTDVVGMLPTSPTDAEVALAAAAEFATANFAHSGFALHMPLVWTPLLLCQGQELPFELSVSGDTCCVKVDETTHHLAYRDGAWRHLENPQLRYAKTGSGVTVFGAATWPFTRPTYDDFHMDVGAVSGVIAPMPGAIVDVFVIPGQTVVAGEALIAIEAMKMQHVIRALADQCIDSIAVAAGDHVAADQVLITFETNEAD